MPSTYRRVLLKISGDGFSREMTSGIDTDEILSVAEQAKAVAALGIELAIVVGGGNIVRGAQVEGGGIRRATADYMGMLATLINGLALQDVLESIDVETRVLTAITTEQVAEPFIRRRATRHLEKKRVVILAGGTGNPYFTTDTTAALRGVEIGADILLKATKVDGVYSADPKKDPTAKRFKKLTYLEVLNRQLGVMDYTAISLCMVHRLPILVFNLKGERAFERAVQGEDIGTLIVPE
ncbi:MAG: UMP kinase [Planctomycetota bacterium]|nr:UMP kinase [Planctomycetota bacterium]